MGKKKRLSQTFTEKQVDSMPFSKKDIQHGHYTGSTHGSQRNSLGSSQQPIGIYTPQNSFDSGVGSFPAPPSNLVYSNDQGG